ncbi:hypothetical protein E2562_030048 [Oryza meyeriana var. granulata]|uniref:Uncharacterized protein n=1 Tax=Oryza meyeriana var. granulata TaxID=110450 RepID=A0A6G1CJH0_9ORYZ|nr:hypothetical protein E2562_030048 [Oryza meyeriana var. granulata]
MGEKRAPPAPGPTTREVCILLVLPPPLVVLQEWINCAWETQIYSHATPSLPGEEREKGGAMEIGQYPTSSYSKEN